MQISNCHKTSLVSFFPKFVRKYSSCKKILREVRKVMKISLVYTNEKKECSYWDMQTWESNYRALELPS